MAGSCRTKPTPCSGARSEEFLNHRQQLTRLERLCHHGHVGWRAHQRFPGKGRHEEHIHRWVETPDFLDKLQAGHTRHDHIGHNTRDRSAVEDLDRLHAICCLVHDKAGRRTSPTIRRTSSSSSTRRMASLFGVLTGRAAEAVADIMASGLSGKAKRKILPFPTMLPAVTYPPYCRTMPYTVTRLRPVPRPGFVVKNGSNKRFLQFGCHANSCIFDAELNVAAGLNPMRKGCLIRNRDQLCAHRDGSPIGHCVARVTDQREQESLN